MSKKFSFLFIFIALLLDQLSKFFVMKFMSINESITVIKDFFYLTYYKNTGAAFGLFSGHLLFIILMTLIIFVYLIIEIKKSKNSKLSIISISMIIGGLLGNLIDRLVFGYVRDFLDFYIFNYNFAVFNLADTLIVVGTFLLILNMIREDYNVNKNKRGK